MFPAVFERPNTRKPAAADPRFSPLSHPISDMILEFDMKFQG
jgi:hypothetical protein